ncbi:MAG TPA: LacI family DNA-binding transcriptional regulator [Acidobacteriaceae bacterium]|nr:LacI family DNA-binding transcriptional regulator [Acidobacteriaceae bacterium]
MDIREIARRAKVSHSTVSRVINNVPTVDAKLAKRVQAVIEEVGYRPNYQARALARGRSHTVGLIVSEISGGNPFFAEIILYFERCAVENGFEVLISFADTETDPNHIAVCADRMKERRVEGIAVLTFGMEQSLHGDAGKLPMVYAGADRQLEGIRNIRVNYQSGFRDAVKHLAEFGHKRIGYLSGNLDWSSMRMRYEALRKAMRSAGLPLQKDLVIECNHTLEGGAEGIAKLLSLPKPPTAVMCCNDMAAIGALKTMSARSLVAGRDVSLIGFDDLTLCSFTQPSLTTIRFSPSELASLAFRALLEDIRQDKVRHEYEYKTRFVLRDSTGAPRAQLAR